MQQVSVTINGRSYPVACDEGDEKRIQALAQVIDGKVANFARQVGQAGEARLLVLAALVLADELAEANEALQHVPGAAAAGESRAIAVGVERLAARVEAVAAKLESSHI
ncbi:MAG TPA: cell division protein ZapA [Stellaceae bacterium]|nr:cell division protein ZapA [Stellaceae bacterium]